MFERLYKLYHGQPSVCSREFDSGCTLPQNPQPSTVMDVSIEQTASPEVSTKQDVSPRKLTPFKPHLQPRTRVFDRDYETVPQQTRLNYCLKFSVGTHLFNFALGYLLSKAFWAINPFWWMEINYLTCSFVGFFIHWLGHQKESGRWFRAHTMQHHILLYPPQRFLNTIEHGSSDPNAKFYYPVLGLSFLMTYYFTGGLFYAMICFLHTGLWLIFLDYLHTAFHSTGFWMERYEWFIALRELHYLHHKGEMLDNLGVIDFFTDFFIGSFAMGVM